MSPPASVRFSKKGDSVACINAVIQEIWPFVSRAILLEIRELLEPLILNNIPSYLPSVVFTRLDLGSSPPKIKSISIRDDAHDPSTVLGALAESIAAALSVDFQGHNQGKTLSSAGTSVGALGASSHLLSSSLRHFNGALIDGVIDQATVSEGLVPIELVRGGTPVQSHACTHDDGPEAAASSVVIEMGVEYEGNPNIEMALASSLGTTFGIDSVRVSGSVEVIVAPLISRVPLAAAFQACFLNRPTIDFNLTGIAAAGDMGPWTAFFRSTVDQVFSSLAVLPNRVVCKIDPGVDFLKMCRPSHPVGILRLAVLRGFNFPHTDANPIKQTLGKSAEPDVYLVLRLGATTHRTETINDAADPIFNNQIFDFILCSNSPQQQLQVDAYDDDLGQDDELGNGKVSPMKLIRESEVEVRLNNSPLGALPRIRLAAHFIRLSSALADVQTAVVSLRTDKTRPSSCSFLMLAVAIDCASNLPTGGRTRPFVRVLLNDKQILKTWPALELDGAGWSSTANPRWEFSRHILVDSPVNSETRVTFEVCDSASSNDLMGTAFLHLADLLKYPGCANIYNFALCGAWRADSTLRVRVGLEAVVTESVPLWQLCSAEQQLEKVQRRTGVASEFESWVP